MFDDLNKKVIIKEDHVRISKKEFEKAINKDDFDIVGIIHDDYVVERRSNVRQD